MNNPYLILLRSILIVFSVSLFISMGVGFITQSFIRGIVAFVITTIAQFALNALFLNISDRRNKTAEFLAQQILTEAKERRMPFILNCAYCNTPNQAGISFTDENSFICVKCQQPNKVYIQFTTVRVTTPIAAQNIKGEIIDTIENDVETGVSQTTINEPIKVNEK